MARQSSGECSSGGPPADLGGGALARAEVGRLGDAGHAQRPRAGEQLDRAVSRNLGREHEVQAPLAAGSQRLIPLDLSRVERGRWPYAFRLASEAGGYRRAATLPAEAMPGIPVIMGMSRVDSGVDSCRGLVNDRRTRGAQAIAGSTTVGVTLVRQELDVLSLGVMVKRQRLAVGQPFVELPVVAGVYLVPQAS